MASDIPKYNRLLERQLRRNLPDWENGCEDLKGLLKVVSQSYDQFERDRQLVERSMELSSAEMMEKNRSLDRYTNALKRSNAELESYAHAVAHDLKTPLRHIVSFTDLINSNVKPETQSRIGGFVKKLRAASDRIGLMLDKMLQLTTVNHNQLQNFQEVNLNRIVLDIEKSNTNTLQKYGGSIVVTNQLPHVFGHPAQMHELFAQLVDNSIQFRASEEALKVTIKGIKNTDGYIFSVTDNGLGIQSAYHDQVFELFRQLEPNDVQGSVGFGLPLCKKIVENHGGAIWIDDTYTNGTRIMFTLPKYSNFRSSPNNRDESPILDGLSARVNAL